MVFLCSTLLALGLGLLGLLLAWSSPGRPRPFVGPDGRPLAASISEKVHAHINGVEQGMIIKGRDQSKPVLLMGHSGGSFLGMHAIARAPELYQAYIGVAQMANQLDSEVSAYERAFVHP
jgi:hypothetical protein